MKNLDGIKKINTKNENYQNVPELSRKASVRDAQKRRFIKMAGIAGVGALVYSLIPKQAHGIIFGSSMRTDSVGIKNATGTQINPATEDKQDDIINELQAFSSPITTNVILTNADTDYLLPSSEKANRRTVIVSNNSTYDVYLGQAGEIDADASTPIGILLPAGGSLILDCSAGLYAQSNTAGISLSVTEF